MITVINIAIMIIWQKRLSKITHLVISWKILSLMKLESIMGQDLHNLEKVMEYYSSKLHQAEKRVGVSNIYD